MGQWELFDHTADLGLRIHASDLTDLFQTAAEALLEQIVTNRQDVAPIESERVALAADSPEAVLAAWLNELIFRIETGHRLFSRFEVTAAPDGLSLEAVIHGEPIDPGRHILDHEVKAVTHHALKLTRGADGLTAELILDI